MSGPFWQREITHEAKALLEIIPDNGAWGAEIGTLRAKTACILLHRRPGLKMVLVDSWDDDNETMQVVGQTGDETHAEAMANIYPFRDRVTVIRNTSVKAAAELPAAWKFDFIHLDADHYYDSVLADCRAWWPKVRRGGWLCGHDIDHPLWPDWGVRQAVEEFSTEIGLPFTVNADLMHWRIKKVKR